MYRSRQTQCPGFRLSGRHFLRRVDSKHQHNENQDHKNEDIHKYRHDASRIFRQKIRAPERYLQKTEQHMHD